MGICLVLLLGLLTSFPGPTIAAECSSGRSAETTARRCAARLSERSIAGTTSASDTSTVAVFSGPPKDGSACDGSLTIGDNVGWYGNGTPGTITDINVIEQVSSKPSAFDRRVSDTVTAGWLYLDERGNYWVQLNGRALRQISAKTRTFFASLGLPKSGGLAVATTGRHPPNIRSAHLQLQRCWSEGKI